MNQIPFRTGATFPSGCTNTAIAPGLTDCDLKIFNTTGITSSPGLDSDHDDIPDLIELLRSTNLVSADGADVVNDILENRDVNDPVPLPASRVLSYSIDATNTPCNGLQKSSVVTITNLPLVLTVAATDTKPYTSIANGLATPKTFDLSHGDHQNVIAFIAISEPQDGSDNKELYYYILKVTPASSGPDITIQTTDFAFLGEIN